MKNFEKVEAYFNNELSDSEKNDFFKKIESDTDLKSEFDFQSEVVNGIKEARKAELKAMLNRVPIASTGSSAIGSSFYKIIAGGAVAILMGSSIWYFMNTDTKAQFTQKPKEVVSTITTKTENPIALNQQEPATIEKVKTNSTEKIESNEKSKSSTLKIITPNLPNSEDVLANKALPEENLNIPDAINNGSINLSSKINVEVKLKKKYSFHYQYSSNGIVLYGDFEEGLFEILELNKDHKTTIYLYYESNYYSLNNDTSVITPLKPVTDKNITHKLEALR